jgi:murein DD-endopeptidase MepM/ murein hydrolase activator NlpD
VASYGRSHHDYPATDIFAPCGTPAVAVTGGVIQEVSRTDEWSSANDNPAIRGGLSYSMVGDDGVRYYGSHLATVAPDINPGTRVEKGRQIGTVGDTGNARGTGCHLHFGLSPPCGPGDWQVRRGTVYPWSYLDSWRSGGGRSPVDEVQAWNARNRAC